MVSVQFRGIQEVVANLERYHRDQIARLRLACEEVAQLLERSAIMNHPWTVRTGGTNVTTRGTWEELPGDLFKVVLSAGMDYNRYLELAGPVRGDYASHVGSLPHTAFDMSGSGKYAWLWPVFINQHQAVLDTFARHLKH